VSVEGSRQRALASLRDLKSRWAQAQELWTDATAAEFGDRYVEQLEQAIRSALPAMEKMAETLHRMQRDCRDPS